MQALLLMTRIMAMAAILACGALPAADGDLAAQIAALPPAPAVVAGDWLAAAPMPHAVVCRGEHADTIALDNGLVRRLFRLGPNAATVSLANRPTGIELVRAVEPEARLRIDGVDFPVGGLVGQPVRNYLTWQWLDGMTADPTAFRFQSFAVGPTVARFPWKKHPEWMPQDAPWPPPGASLTLSFAVPASARWTKGERIAVDVHYELYDGLPLLCKWLTVRNGGSAPMRLDSAVSELLAVAEPESTVEANVWWEQPPLYVETDYAFMAQNGKSATARSVRWLPDPNYPTQVHYECKTPCLLECGPEFGPAIDLAPGELFTSIRSFELVQDSSERERRGLAQRRMYRVIAPWVTENPLLMHLISSNPDQIRAAVDQCAEVGFEMLILSFGSGFDFESRDAAYQKRFRELADYARERHVALGGYSLLASRGAGSGDDCKPGRIRFGVMPCLAARWGIDYLAQLRSFIGNAGMGVLEHDGSYPGDTCAATDHPGHHGLEDSQWRQWQAITAFYEWCRSQGVYLNIPDWYFLTGGSKICLGYRETNWSLPREEQVLIERQNVFDGTWEKTPSMGWMFVPLTQYHGGGAAATIEPLDQHRDHYQARLADLLGAGVQACWRGPRLYDSQATKDMVKQWVAFYKQHRPILDSDIIHLRRPDGRDWDGILHINARLPERGLAMIYNPLGEPIQRRIRLPLHYADLHGQVRVQAADGSSSLAAIDSEDNATITVAVPAEGRTWLVLSRP